MRTKSFANTQGLGVFLIILWLIMATNSNIFICEAGPSLAPIQAGSGTEVGGFISSDTTWKIKNSPYIVIEDVIIEPDILLTIEPGTVIKFTETTSLIVDGGLFAQGNSTHKITFTSNSLKPEAGYWESIRFKDSSKSSIIKWAIVKYANRGIRVDRSSHRIENSIIQNNNYGVSVMFSPGTITISNSSIFNNTWGIYTWEIGTGNQANVYDSTIFNNEYGISMDILHVRRCNVSINNIVGIKGRLLSIHQSLISKNKGKGIACYYGTTTITYSTITDNEENGLFANQYRYGPITQIHYSQIYNNSPYDIYNEIDTDVNATHNWWGTTKKNLIDEHIYDYYDDYNLGRILYKPYLELEPSAKFELSDIIILPKEIELGNNITISFVISNIGEKSGDYAFILDIEGPEYDYAMSVDGFMEAGESDIFSHTIAPDQVGNYSVEIDSLIGNFKVKATPPPPPPPPDIPTVTTQDTTDKYWKTETFYWATLHGTIVDTGGENCVQGFEWGSSSGTYTQGYELPGTHGVGPFEHTDSFTGTVYYRAYARNSEGEGYGSEKSFTPPPPLPPVLSNLTITPDEVELGDEVTIRFVITNADSRSYVFVPFVQIGDTMIMDDVELEGHESRTVSHKVTPDTVGDYEVKVDGLEGSFTVFKPESSFLDKIPGFSYESIIIGLIAVIIIMWRVCLAPIWGSKVPKTRKEMNGW